MLALKGDERRNENSPERNSMTREEATRDRYWRLRKELDELYRRQIVVGELERSVGCYGRCS